MSKYLARANAIFSNPLPPVAIWQERFDKNYKFSYEDLVAKPQDQIALKDLYVYVEDLNEVDQLQPDLFAYLFPVCLRWWAETLLENKEFHTGNWYDFHTVFPRRNLVPSVMTEEQLRKVRQFFNDVLTERLDQERGIHVDGETCREFSVRAHAWLGRFNTMGVVLPTIEPIWTRWWSLATPGRAVAAIEYASGFVYDDGQNPIFDLYDDGHRYGTGGGGPFLFGTDTIFHGFGWTEASADYLKSTLSYEYLRERMDAATLLLRETEEESYAKQLASDLSLRESKVKARLDELPSRLQTLHRDGDMGWRCEGKGGWLFGEIR